MPRITPSEYARALLVATDLKEQLERRLIDATSDGFTCTCGSCNVGESIVVGINIPKDKDQLAQWTLWTCQMRDDSGQKWSVGLNSYIARTELYAMFRNAFWTIDIVVDRPSAELFCDSQPDIRSNINTTKGRLFIGSGRTVVVDQQNPAFVRPYFGGDKSVWMTAELRCDFALKKYLSEGPLVCCNIDPYALDQPCGPGKGVYSVLENATDLPTFYVWIPDGSEGRHVYLPIARIIEIDPAAKKATFELDTDIESYIPLG